jgi:pimeloyl-ACP methyl ester carboxylesterase
MRAGANGTLPAAHRRHRRRMQQTGVQGTSARSGSALGRSIIDGASENRMNGTDARRQVSDRVHRARLLRLAAARSMPRVSSSSHIVMPRPRSSIARAGSMRRRLDLDRRGSSTPTRTPSVLSELPAHATARVQRLVVAARTSLCDLEPELKAIAAPVLLLLGDEDEPTLDVNLWMKRLMPTARPAVVPRTGHVVNLEEPALFNWLVERFVGEVERGIWRPRDPRALPLSP